MGVPVYTSRAVASVWVFEAVSTSVYGDDPVVTRKFFSNSESARRYATMWFKDTHIVDDKVTVKRYSVEDMTEEGSE